MSICKLNASYTEGRLLKDLPTKSTFFIKIHNIFDCHEATERVTLVDQCNVLNLIIFQLKLMVTRTEHLFFRPLENVMDDPHIDSNHLTGQWMGFCVFTVGKNARWRSQILINRPKTHTYIEQH